MKVPVNIPHIPRTPACTSCEKIVMNSIMEKAFRKHVVTTVFLMKHLLTRMNTHMRKRMMRLGKGK